MPTSRRWRNRSRSRRCGRSSSRRASDELVDGGPLMATTRVEKDRHYDCARDRCVAPPPVCRPGSRGHKACTAEACQAPARVRCTPRRVFWVRSVNRKGERVSRAFKTEAAAREDAGKVEAAKTLGVDYQSRPANAPTAPTFRKVAEAALQLHIQLNALGPSTIRNHRMFLAHHLLPAFGDKPVTPDAFSRLQIKGFIAELRRVLKDSSLKSMLPTFG